jgi:hypothetical protein
MVFVLTIIYLKKLACEIEQTSNFFDIFVCTALWKTKIASVKVEKLILSH